MQHNDSLADGYKVLAPAGFPQESGCGATVEHNDLIYISCSGANALVAASLESDANPIFTIPWQARPRAAARWRRVVRRRLFVGGNDVAVYDLSKVRPDTHRLTSCRRCWWGGAVRRAVPFLGSLHGRRMHTGWRTDRIQRPRRTTWCSQPRSVRVPHARPRTAPPTTLHAIALPQVQVRAENRRLTQFGCCACVAVVPQPTVSGWCSSPRPRSRSC